MNNSLHDNHAVLTGSDIFEFLPESALIGLHTDFIDELEQFNNTYSFKLEVKKTFHWKNGTYDKIRAKTIECLLPWLNNKPRGSHSITQHSTHRYNSFRNDLLRLENKMSNKRWNKYIMGDESDHGFTKWSNWLDAFMRGIENFNTELMEIPIIGTRFFGRRYREQYHNEDDSQWHEVADDKPYIMFQFNLPDVKIHLFNDNILIASIPWGGLSVYLEMDLYWWVNTLGNTAARDRMSGRWTNMKVFTPYVIQEPIYDGLQHPYIKSEMGRYSGGNACFGDHGRDITKRFHGFQWSLLYETLMSWASTYNMNSTAPLHKYWLCSIGKKLEYVNMHPTNKLLNRNRISAFKDNFKADPSICDRVFRSHYDSDKTAFIYDNCDHCLLSGIITDSQGGCEMYNNHYAPDAFNYQDEVMSLLVDGLGFDRNKFYENNNNSLSYFGLSISNLAERFQRHFGNGQNRTDDMVTDARELSTIAQEELFAVQIQKAELINELGEVCNWTRNVIPRYTRGSQELYRDWTYTHRDYSEAFLLVLINKHERINKERNE